jgi:tRNA threonylcarbamoyladenosine biosynthesis protein TsaB
VKLLALDTSSLACTVALQVGSDVVERHEEQPREHTRILLPMIREVMAEAGLVASELDAIVLGNGPGSFIGMRIAASVAQGMAYAAGLGIVPVSSLAAVAAEVLADADVAEVIVSQDAHMNEVYLGLFRRGDDGLPVALAPERLAGQLAIGELQQPAAGRRLAAGFGWRRYPELLAQNVDRLAGVSDVLHPRARCLLGPGAARYALEGSLPPQDVSPAYLRHKVAERPEAAS